MKYSEFNEKKKNASMNVITNKKYIIKKIIKIFVYISFEFNLRFQYRYLF